MNAPEKNGEPVNKEHYKRIGWQIMFWGLVFAVASIFSIGIVVGVLLSKVH